MRIRQRAYLRLSSEGFSPDEITALVGAQPNSSKVLGSRVRGPLPLPRSHLWLLESGVSDQAPLSNHLDALLPRLVEIANGLRTFTSRPDSAAYVQIVRYFDEGPEEFDEATWGAPPDARFERLGGQHPFLGFGLDADQVRLLGELGVGIDVDEYG